MRVLFFIWLRASYCFVGYFNACFFFHWALQQATHFLYCTQTQSTVSSSLLSSQFYNFSMHGNCTRVLCVEEVARNNQERGYLQGQNRYPCCLRLDLRLADTGTHGRGVLKHTTFPGFRRGWFLIQATTTTFAKLSLCHPIEVGEEFSMCPDLYPSVAVRSSPRNVLKARLQV